MMRYRDLFDAKAWKKYKGRDRRCRLVPVSGSQSDAREVLEVPAQWGVVHTGKQRVFAGYFVQVVLPSDEEVLSEDPHVLWKAFAAVEKKLNAAGWSLDAVGLSPDWQESGLSANSGYGYHPDVVGAVHFFEPLSSIRRG